MGDSPGFGNGAPNETFLSASFGGDQVFDTVNTGIPNWLFETFKVEATNTSSQVYFTAVSPPGEHYLGDISVTDDGVDPNYRVPDFASTLGLLGATLAGLTVWRRKWSQ